jgi:hypothetical protein
MNTVTSNKHLSRGFNKASKHRVFTGPVLIKLSLSLSPPNCTFSKVSNWDIDPGGRGGEREKERREGGGEGGRVGGREGGEGGKEGEMQVL